MPETTYFCPKLKCVCVDSYGKVELADVEQSIKESAALLKEYDSQQLIVDVRQQEVTLEFVDTFDLYKNLIRQLPEHLKIAYIVNDPPKQSHRFFKLISDGLGHPVKAFFDVESALAWLAGKDYREAYPYIGKVKFPGIDCFPYSPSTINFPKS